MRFVIYLSVYLLLCSPVLAYYRPEAVDLSGEWQFCTVAPMIDVVPDRYVRPDFPQLSPAWDEVINPAAAPPVDAQWMDVNVPMAWENYTNPGYNEAGWYKTTMRIPSAWLGGRSYKKTDAEGLSTNLWVGDKHYWLEFDSVATAAGVWINGEFIGAHVGDYSRWRLEITEAVARELEVAAQRRKSDSGQVSSPSSLEIQVYVDELPGHITQGFLSMIAPHHGGIWQEVRAYTTGGVSLSPDGIYISTDWEKQTATIELSFDGAWDSATNFPLVSVIPIGQHASNYTLYSSMLDTTMQWDFNVQTNQLTMVCNLAGQELVRWSPDIPALYQATISLPGIGTGAGAGDHLLIPFAFRDIRMEGSKVLLNGEPIKIRSVLNWGYYPGVYGSAPSPQTVRNEFAYIKSLGFNAETVCLINMPDYFYTIADQMGVLIWQEYPTWHNDFDAKHIETYRREFSAYLRRDRNHPSIIMRSLSVEAGVADWDVIDELYALAKEMTHTPVQDNNSWFSHSRPEYTDWYGEDNYFNNAQWERHLRDRLPKQLDEYPEKPYIIGESILFNSWPDIDGLEAFVGATPASPESGGGDAAATILSGEAGLAPTGSGKGGDSASPLQGIDWQPPEGMPAYLGGESDNPWWFPSCYASCKEINAELRARYNPGFGKGVDIVNDYLLPQSTQYALDSRRFQIEMLDSDPRFAGYTVNCVRDMPLIRAGLLDSLERPRWAPWQWAWHGTPVARASVLAVESGDRDAAATDVGNSLTTWDRTWDRRLIRDVPVLAMREGYIDLKPILGLLNMRWIDDTELDETRGMPLPTDYSQVVLTSVLTHKLVDYMERGGVVILLTSKWPGGLGSYHHYFWRDAIFVPPVGPWQYATRLDVSGTMELPSGKTIPIPFPVYIPSCDEIVSLQPYSLNLETTNVIPVQSLGIADAVDPLLRLYDTHDLSSVVTYDQIFATKVGDGLFIASSLDHSTTASKHLLGVLAKWSKRWLADEEYLELQPLLDLASEGKQTRLPRVREFPQTEISVEKLHELAVSRPNGIMPLDHAWAFSLDEMQVGESVGWMLPGYDASEWDTLRAGAGWESQGYSYNGMAWYIREIDVPENWRGGKLRLVAEGIDDAYTVWVNGKAVATHGSFTVHEETVWLQQTVTDLTDHLIPGETNTLALQVVDITGQGGIWKPIYLAVDE